MSIQRIRNGIGLKTGAGPRKPSVYVTTCRAGSYTTRRAPTRDPWMRVSSGSRCG